MKSDLMKIPGIGANMARHLICAGYSTIEMLKGQDPDDLYAADCLAQGKHVDRCALYCYRLAIYYADHDGQLPEDRRNWWNWKN